jgi:hypothetical protein
MATTYTLSTFADLYTAIMEELKIQAGDTASLNRIKRNINMVYLNEVVPFKRWKWLDGEDDLTVAAAISAGTASVTEGERSIDLSVDLDGDVAGYWFSVQGQTERYKIATGDSGTITLEEPFTGDTNATASYQIWTDRVYIPTSWRETISVTQDFCADPLQARGIVDIAALEASDPKLEGRPLYYAPNADDNELRYLQVYPSLNTESTVLHVTYTNGVTALAEDADQPLIPAEDRIVLFYGALVRSWTRERDPEEAASIYAQYQAKLRRMAGKVYDGNDSVRLQTDRAYLAGKRRQRTWRND